MSLQMIKLLKPIDGKVIPMPEYNYKPLPIEGMELQLSAYWNDRINQNDVFGRNFLLDKNDRVTIIDFGVAGELDTKTLTVIEGLVDACRANLSDKKALRELKVYLISLDPTLNDWLFQRGYSTQPYSTELLDFPLSLPDKVVESCKSGLCNPMNTEPKRIAKNERKRDRYDDELEARKLDKLEEENDRKRDRGGKRHTKYVGTRKKTRTRRKV